MLLFLLGLGEQITLPQRKRLILMELTQNLLLDLPGGVSGNVPEKDTQGAFKAGQALAVVQHCFFRIREHLGMKLLNHIHLLHYPFVFHYELNL